jgi:hypothetical protein
MRHRATAAPATTGHPRSHAAPMGASAGENSLARIWHSYLILRLSPPPWQRQARTGCSRIRLLSDTVVVDALGDLSSCATSDAEPTMFKTMQHSTRRLRPMRRVLARHRPVTANSSLWSLRGSEFEQRVAASFGEVILWSVVDAYVVSAQNGDGRPNARAEQPAHEVQLAVWLERAPKNRCRFI